MGLLRTIIKWSLLLVVGLFVLVFGISFLALLISLGPVVLLLLAILIVLLLKK